LKLELNHKRKFGRNTNTWRLKSILLKNEWVNQEIKELKNSWKLMRMRTHQFKTSGMQQRRSFLRGKYISIQDSLKKLEKSQNHKLTLHLKGLEKEQQIKSKLNRRREIINIRAEINEIETRRIVEQINKTGSWFFERINKINKPLARPFQKKRERIPIF